MPRVFMFRFRHELGKIDFGGVFDVFQHRRNAVRVDRAGFLCRNDCFRRFDFDFERGFLACRGENGFLRGSLLLGGRGFCFSLLLPADP